MLLLLWATACGGTTLQTVEDGLAPTGGSAAASAGSRQTNGGPGSAAGSGDTSSLGGEATGARSSGGAAGESNAAGAANGGEVAVGGAGPIDEGGGSSSPECVSFTDCPALSGTCTYQTCDAGECVVANAALGTLVKRNTPADCHDTVCDGQGAEIAVVDLDNPPASVDSCAVVACSADGDVSSTPSVLGAACSGADGGKLCDGKGLCVACLAKADCELGNSCSNNQCVPDSCHDGFKDGLETDVDCGGPCAPCAVFKDCSKDADCESEACDSFAPHRCLADHCQDHHPSGDESDIDCGGSCAKCVAGHCHLDADCVSAVCMANRSNLCLSPQCVDGVQQANETDLDCGGGICNGCAIGQKCFAYWDCASQACNGETLLCQADHCTDHRHDGDETDTDCGGTCAGCVLGKKCRQTSDCEGGLKCWPGFPHVCL